MNQPNFQAMNQKELRDYFLSHREDRDAFYAYIDKLHTEGNWIEMPPLKSLEDLENYPDFFYGNHIQGSAGQSGGTKITNINQPQDLASAAKEIQELLEQLSETHSITTLSEKSAIAEKAIAHIKSDRNWLGKVVGIIKVMGKEAFFEEIDHPAANVLRAGFEELLSTES
ncbi:DUF6887 family protein [Spirulina sp. 06S082]|uniref:DUF6887 family protein n=1 Tax=Spirulina sp. 06S082 TaxID=3110248 RepID=UPI002B208494|nr:hypothetical protein [Spirulina sp. 06S082]MEA5467695.1 hypothetical protein [Spirulina sp. 06S082]